MSGTPRELPARPSKEHLRKQAKRLANDQSIALAVAQRRLASEYGLRSWADLMRRVDEVLGNGIAPVHSPLAAAARARRSRDSPRSSGGR